MNTTQPLTQQLPCPPILQRYVNEVAKGSPEYFPRMVRRRFHGVEVSLWEGRVNVTDIEGWVENPRLLFYLRDWRSKQSDSGATPTTRDIYDIMVGADREAEGDGKPFHIDRMAKNIKMNGVQEPIIVYASNANKVELWDGNRRFFSTMHIMEEPAYLDIKDQAQWIPAYVVTPTGDPVADERIKQVILTEMNFVSKDHIPWPNYVRAERIFQDFERMTFQDPSDPTLRRKVKEKLSEKYGLKGWRVADRWIKMYDLAQDFKEYHEEEHQRDEVDVDLFIQKKFEYFDELSKRGVWGYLEGDPDARDEVFDWLWDEKFQSFSDVRKVPEIFEDPIAVQVARQPDSDSFRRAIATVIANDPTRVKSKEAANEKIQQFADWLDTFKREDYKQISCETLERLQDVLHDVVGLLQGLQASNQQHEGDY